MLLDAHKNCYLGCSFNYSNSKYLANIYIIIPEKLFLPTGHLKCWIVFHKCRLRIHEQVILMKVRLMNQVTTL